VTCYRLTSKVTLVLYGCMERKWDPTYRLEISNSCNISDKTRLLSDSSCYIYLLVLELSLLL
jgi:hypothetical protein